jgi:hypothetical protein
MARYGGWEDRPWQGREGERDEDRWRTEGERRWRAQSLAGGERAGGRGREDWREDEGRRWEPRHEWPDWSSERREHGAGGYGGAGGRWEPERWTGRGRGAERDRPWVEPSPDRRARGDTRGLVEWEDRGPLAWLRDKLRGTSRPSRGPKGYTRSDDRIEDEVCERIARSGVDSDDIEVKVEHREVTLTGTVSSRDEKWWLESLVDDVFGVEEVHNRLRVGRAPAAGTTTETRDLPH